MKFLKAPDSAAAKAAAAQDFLAANPAAAFILLVGIVAIVATYAVKELF